MLDLGRHAIYIWMSYGSAALIGVLLVLRLLWDGRRYARQLAALEASGVRRRSDAAPRDRAD